MRSAALLFALALAVNPAAAPQTAKPAAPAAAEKLPPLSYTCPMHPEILENKGGTCPICKMDLVPIRLDSVWTCGTKPLAVVRDAPGPLPDRRHRAGAGDRRRLVDLRRRHATNRPRPAPAPTVRRRRRPTRCARTAITTRSTAACSSWPATTRTISRARTCRPARSGCTSTTSSPSRRSSPTVKSYKATLMVKDPKTGKDTPYSLVRSGALSAGVDRQAAAAGGDVRAREVRAGRQGQPLRLHVPRLLEGAARARRVRR